MTKNVRTKRLIWITYTSSIPVSGRKPMREHKLGRNLEAGADPETMKECSKLLDFFQPTFLYHPRWPVKSALMHIGLIPPLSLIKKMFYRIAYTLILWEQFLNWSSPLAVFMSTWHKLDSSKRKETQLRKDLHKLQLWDIASISNNGEGPRPL